MPSAWLHSQGLCSAAWRHARTRRLAIERGLTDMGQETFSTAKRHHLLAHRIDAHDSFQGGPHRRDVHSLHPHPKL
jgi:hypothetical protein